MDAILFNLRERGPGDARTHDVECSGMRRYATDGFNNNAAASDPFRAMRNLRGEIWH
jgi:hypothetical protein